MSIQKFCLVLVTTLVVSGTLSAQEETIKPTGAVETIQEGFAFTEGPAWDPSSGSMYFTDIPNTTIHKWSEKRISAFTKSSGHANGLMIAKDGRMLACQMDGQVVAYNTKTAPFTVLADKFEGKRFNAPNDLVIDKDGGIYFTDPLFRAPTPLPQGVQAVYYISKDKDVTRVTGDIAAPNGIGLSPDGSKLYVCPSKQEEMLVYDVAGPGKISNQQTFCKVRQPEGKSGTGADGIALDVEGNVYITTHLGVQIFSPTGHSRGLVKFPQQPANVTFGGPERKRMFVTARTGFYAVDMPIAGLAPN